MTGERGYANGFGQYVGIPWVLNGESQWGADCWGLVRLVVRREQGVLIAHASALGSAEARAIAARFEAVRELVLGDGLFVPAEGDHQELDLIEMRIRGPGADHIGIVAGGMVLHSRVHIGSHRTPFDRLEFPIVARWRLV